MKESFEINYYNNYFKHNYTKRTKTKQKQKNMMRVSFK